MPLQDFNDLPFLPIEWPGDISIPKNEENAFLVGAVVEAMRFHERATNKATAIMRRTRQDVKDRTPKSRRIGILRELNVLVTILAEYPVTTGPLGEMLKARVGSFLNAVNELKAECIKHLGSQSEDEKWPSAEGAGPDSEDAELTGDETDVDTVVLSS
ncbi:hypothetical protein SEUCBS139899_001722 [Sporothrix eucalyptigena]|uniref:Uncharacterized protein n=1 Tax=Sporothrix eucalyptigena TaxID=1812306 RepID=A0ABP0BYN9_9PEZI